MSPYGLVVSILLVSWFLAGSCDGCHHTVLRVLWILVDAGCNVGFATYWRWKSRCSWAWRVWQRSVRSSPCCFFQSVCHFWWVVVSDHWSTRRNIRIRDRRRVFRMRERPVYLREALLSRIKSNFWHTRSLFLLFALRRWRQQPSSDFLDTNSAELRPFQLIMCIDGPESTTNSLSSGFIADGAGKHHSLVCEKR